MKLKRAISYSAAESIGSRFFDFVTLWIVLNSLGSEDLALFGLATAAIFVFNIFLLSPETALFKYQKTWSSEGSLLDYLGAFVGFSFIKVILSYSLSAAIFLWNGADDWYFYAFLFSVITQNIQMAEIARIYFRMELQQKSVAAFEIKTKLILTISMITLFFYNSVDAYFIIYLLWSTIVACLWLVRLQRSTGFLLVGLKRTWALTLNAFKDYSLWAHISGVMTAYIYGGGVIYLGVLAVSDEKIALFTVVSKVMNLFFVIPMFLQSFVPVVLANSRNGDMSGFYKVAWVSFALSLGQLLFFIFLGKYIGLFFGVSGPDESLEFFTLGTIVCFGIFFLNVFRPLSTYLLIKGSPRRLMVSVFIPSAVIATVVFPLSIYICELQGLAYSISSVYSLMSLFLLIQYVLLAKKRRGDAIV